MGEGTDAIRYTQDSFSAIQVGKSVEWTGDWEKDLPALLKAEGIKESVWSRGDTTCSVYGFGIKMYRGDPPSLWDALFVIDFGDVQDLVFTDCPPDTMAFLMKYAVRAVVLPHEVDADVVPDLDTDE